MSDSAQPGPFIAQRPRLAITLTLAVLALAGFSGSALLSSDTLGHALARLEVVFKVSLLVGALLIVPTLAPNSHATRTVLAALIAIAGGLFAWIAGPVLVGSAAFLPNAAIVVIGFTVAALVLAQPVTGRLLPVLVVCAPVLGLAGLAAVAGYLVRADLPQVLAELHPRVGEDLPDGLRLRLDIGRRILRLLRRCAAAALPQGALGRRAVHPGKRHGFAHRCRPLGILAAAVLVPLFLGYRSQHVA